MELLEYQAKKLFRQVGIPVLPSETIADSRNLKQLQIPYPVVLKSQVKAGGRGKAGGVQFVNNTIDAIAQARSIFNLSILGEYPEVILAEARYNARKELFLGIVLDYELQRPVIFGSYSGGMNVDLLLENLQQVVIEGEFSPFLARRLSVMMGLSGDLLSSVSEIIEKMYRLFRTKDLDFIEINPLGVDEEGQLMALDGKITLSDCVLNKHPELIDLTVVEKHCPDKIFQPVKTSQIRWLDWQNSQGKIALVTNDEELALLNWDLLSQQKAQPACAVIIEPISDREQLLQEQLQQILTRLESQDSITVILINLWSTEAIYRAIAKTLLKLCKSIHTTSSIAEEKTVIPINSFHVRRSSTKSVERSPLESIKFVIRLPQQDIESYRSEFAHEAIIWVNNLEDAVSEAISYTT